MLNASRSRRTVIVKNSPVSFAVMGASGNHRQVLIRSDDRNLDLVGLDNRTFMIEDHNLTDKSLGARSGLYITELRSFLVRTSASYHRAVSEDDSRTSHLSFAWRGLGDGRDIGDIEDTFSMVANDLMAALDSESIESAEWQIAPIIAMCRSKTDARIRRSKRRRSATIFMLAVYVTIGLAIALNYVLRLSL